MWQVENLKAYGNKYKSIVLQDITDLACAVTTLGTCIR